MQLSDVRPSGFFLMRTIIGRAVVSIRDYLVKLLAFLQHRDIGADARLAGLGFLGRLDSPKDRVPVGPAQRLEKRGGFRIAIELGLKLRSNRRSARRVVGALPSSVDFGALDLGEPSGVHAAVLYQSQGLFAIDFGPNALRSPWQDSLQPGFFVLREFQSIDPAVAEEHVQSFRVSHRFYSRILFGNAQPEPRRLAMVLVQPRSEVGLGLEAANWRGGFS